jgi:predicted nucleotide-binding protein (sugar kinase/HSP70/actin superfamily)
MNRANPKNKKQKDKKNRGFIRLKLGYPRALTYYDYYPFWAGFLRELDIELVSTPPTNREIMEIGLKKAPAETCLPIKILIGHLNALSDVDAVFLPRLISMEENTYLCPKVLGIPESLLGTIPKGLEVVTVDINRRAGVHRVHKNLIQWGKCLGKSKHQVLQAFNEGERWLQTYHAMRRQGWGFEESMESFENIAESGKLDNLGLNPRHPSGVEFTQESEEHRPTIALLGHSYLTYEAYANLNLLTKLAEKANLRVVENVSQAVTLEKQKRLRKNIFWSHARTIYGAGESYLDDPEIDGIVYLSCFGCGTDSLTNDILARRARAEQKPYLVVTLDEHTGEAGLVTRLEAFLDMLERRISHEGHLPAHGKCLDYHSSTI